MQASPAALLAAHAAAITSKLISLALAGNTTAITLALKLHDANDEQRYALLHQALDNYAACLSAADDTNAEAQRTTDRDSANALRSAARTLAAQAAAYLDLAASLLPPEPAPAPEDE